MTIWIGSGPISSWIKSIEIGGIWGVREGERLKNWWNEVEKEDLLIMYATEPVSSVVGIGSIESTFCSDESIWTSDEQETEYPYRIRYDLIYVAKDSDQEDLHIQIDDLIISTYGGLKPIRDEDSIKKLIERMNEQWDLQLER